ncbi:uncharacterized protein LOC118764492 isoform X1 [Octopus sinensis]|uniref:Uncharacterized protein LOC118764492 isoform X1 n=2 Tax=Octopus sinensis TaxID=2607531 RepID=A0A7E6F0F4_9MOLL|nr:uncharacterized protein LOC118764492 isoform X1 [Octopus sinensis]
MLLRDMMQMSFEKFAQMASEREEMSSIPKQVWMTDHKSKQQKEFRDKQTELQHQERKPFNNGKQESMSFKAIEKAIKSREQQRSERFTKTQEKRLHDVEKLIQSFQSDQAKIKQQYSLPKWPSYSHSKRTIVSPNSSKSSLHSKNLMTTRTIHTPEAYNTSRVQESKRPHLQSANQSFFSLEHPRNKVPQPNSPTESSSNYVATVSDKPNSSKTKDISRVLSSDKPYQDIVRCQRPEITRKVIVADSKPYIQRLADIKQGNLQSAKVHDKPKLYGVKKIPTDHSNSSKNQKEHLQKGNNSNPLHNQRYEQTYTFHQRIPRHKPLSYTERLRQLSNRGTYTSKGFLNNTVTLKKATLNGHHPQQQIPTQHRMKMTQDKTPVRHHPYGDSHQSPDDYLSDVSEWSLDDRIKSILYEDKKTSEQEFPDEGSNSASDYYDEVISTPQLDPIDVVASLSSCSLSSHIDWTAVEKGLTEQINS